MITARPPARAVSAGRDPLAAAQNQSAKRPLALTKESSNSRPPIRVPIAFRYVPLVSIGPLPIHHGHQHRRRTSATLADHFVAARSVAGTDIFGRSRDARARRERTGSPAGSAEAAGRSSFFPRLAA